MPVQSINLRLPFHAREELQVILTRDGTFFSHQNIKFEALFHPPLRYDIILERSQLLRKIVIASQDHYQVDVARNRFTADEAFGSVTDGLWHVPVILAYPFVGSIGRVGEILISLTTAEVVSHTPLEEMQQTALRLYEAHRGEIETAFL